MTILYICLDGRRAEWALDDVVLGVNESNPHKFEETFDPLHLNIWYRTMNAVTKELCDSNNDALVFSKNGGKYKKIFKLPFEISRNSTRICITRIISCICCVNENSQLKSLIF